MSQQAATTTKFLGIAGLGLLSSSALTLSLSTLPTLLSLPDPTLALPAFWTLRQHTAAAHSLLTLSTTAALGTAYALSARHARHPYLLWMALSAGLGWYGVPKALGEKDMQVFGLEKTDDDDEQALAEEGRGRAGRDVRALNGEVVRERIAGFVRVMGVQSAVWGVGWLMGTVGIWGDGF